MNIAALERRLKRERVHALLVHQRGKLVTSYHKHGQVQLLPINSITKSITATLIGIAIDQGLLSGTQVSLSEFFPNLPKEKQHLTLHHVLTMSTGERWQEFGKGVTYPKQLTQSPNWLDYILAQPLIEPSGCRMNYNSGSSHLLSAILQQISNESTSLFAQKHLFAPLGISEYEWNADPQGICVGGFQMKLHPADLLKIGLLYLHRGRWEGQQIVSADWIGAACTPHFITYRHIGAYGYHWWVLTPDCFDVRFRTYFAMGYAGQYIVIVPELELAAVVSSHMPKRGIQLLRMLLDSFA